MCRINVRRSAFRIRTDQNLQCYQHYIDRNENSFGGGVGGIPQTFIGLLALQLLENCMNMLGINAYVQQVCKGIIILMILWSDCFAKKRKAQAV